MWCRPDQQTATEISGQQMDSFINAERHGIKSIFDVPTVEPSGKKMETTHWAENLCVVREKVWGRNNESCLFFWGKKKRFIQCCKWLDILGNCLWVTMVIKGLWSVCLYVGNQGHIGILICTGITSPHADTAPSRTPEWFKATRTRGAWILHGSASWPH